MPCIAGKFEPVILPEAPPPPDAETCQKCELCRQRSRVVWGEGNPDAPILVLLDNPGAREDAEGRPFVCGTRQTLQLAAVTAGLRLDDLYITYVLKCRPLRRYEKDAARSACLEHLLLQLQRQNPEIAFCLGDTAVRWFFGDAEAVVKNLRGRWRVARGIPTTVSYHPLAVRRRPNLTAAFEEDWKLLARRFFDVSKHHDPSPQ